MRENKCRVDLAKHITLDERPVEVDDDRYSRAILERDRHRGQRLKLDTGPTLRPGLGQREADCQTEQRDQYREADLEAELVAECGCKRGCKKCEQQDCFLATRCPMPDGARHDDRHGDGEQHELVVEDVGCEQQRAGDQRRKGKPRRPTPVPDVQGGDHDCEGDQNLDDVGGGLRRSEHAEENERAGHFRPVQCALFQSRTHDRGCFR